MWQILTITLISVGIVSSDTNCPGFSNYQNDPLLLDKLDGNYLVVYTTSDYVINCEQISWTVGPDNDRTAYLKDAEGCCRRIDNFDSSNPNYFEHNISPVSNCTTLLSTERVGKKLIRNISGAIRSCNFSQMETLSE